MDTRQTSHLYIKIIMVFDNNNPEEITNLKEEIAMLKKSLKKAQQEVQTLKDINRMDDEHAQYVIEEYQKENDALRIEIIGFKLGKRCSSYP